MVGALQEEGEQVAQLGEKGWLHGKPDGQQTRRDILSTLAFTADGEEFVTAALEQVQVRTLPEGRPRLRLEGGEVAYPMADGRLVTLASVDASAGPNAIELGSGLGQPAPGGHAGTER